MKKFLAAIAFLIGATSLTVSYIGVDAVAQNLPTIHFGAMINAMPSLLMPIQTTDVIPVSRPGSGVDGFKVPANTWVQASNNLSDVGSKSTSRANLGVTRAASISDFGGFNDGTHETETNTAFNSCITSGLDCHIPQGTWLISCATHNAALASRFTPSTIYGDGSNMSFLRIAAGCVLPTSGIINLANMRDITIDANSATASAPTTIVSSNTTTSSIQTPEYHHIGILNWGNSSGNGNITALRIGSLAGQTVNNLSVSDSLIQATATSTTVNQCISIVQNATGAISNGSITGNNCVGSGIDADGQWLTIADNDINTWKYRAGIYTEQSANSNRFIIKSNKITNGDVGVINIGGLNVPTDGIVNWGSGSLIQNNSCTNLGGVCVANGGSASTITGNNASGVGKRNDGAGGSAYFSNNQDSAHTGNNSNWSGNFATDDGSGITVVGFEDSAGSANLSLSNNFFNVATPYQLND